MTRISLNVIYMAGLVFAESLRFPIRFQRVRSRKTWHPPAERRGFPEMLVLLAVLLCFWILPAVHVFTRWLTLFDYTLPRWMSWPALAVFGLSLIIRLKAQRDLGGSWSSTIELADSHRFVTSGIYARLRHPIYTSLILWAIAQPVLLQNFIAGLAGGFAVALIWFVRVPAEEKMMGERFGDAYSDYTNRTGRIFPRGKSQDY